MVPIYSLSIYYNKSAMDKNKKKKEKKKRDPVQCLLCGCVSGGRGKRRRLYTCVVFYVSMCVCVCVYNVGVIKITVRNQSMEVYIIVWFIPRNDDGIVRVYRRRRTRARVS